MSATAKNLDWKGKTSGDVKLADVFTSEVKKQAIYESVLGLMASRRQGTASTKERADVRGGGKKPHRQKGTGNARHGSSRSPLFAGGGTTFGPHPRSYDFALPKKVKKAALKSILSVKAQEDKIRVIARFEEKKPSTKQVAAFLKAANIEKPLFLDLSNDVLEKSVQNLEKGAYSDVRSVNVYDLLKYDYVLLTQEALDVLTERAVS